MATIEYIGDGGPDGTVIGKTSTHKLAFYGATPIVRAAATVVGALTAGETTPADVAAAVTDLRDALVNLGLISNT